METWEAITSRRNVRSFADRPLTPIKNPRRRPFGEVVHRDRW